MRSQTGQGNLPGLAFGKEGCGKGNWRISVLKWFEVSFLGKSIYIY